MWRVRRRNLVATVNLDCKLDLKTITLHARNAEYNPKARGGLRRRTTRVLLTRALRRAPPTALCGGHHAHPRPEDHSAHLRVRQDGARPPLPQGPWAHF